MGKPKLDLFAALPVIEERALDAMIAIARELGLKKGVATILILKDGADLARVAFQSINGIGSIERDPDPARGGSDTGTNYLAMALGKIAEMVSTHTDSGTMPRPAKRGEPGVGGGRTTRVMGGYVYAAYSGGTTEQDDQIAAVGMEVLLEQ